MLNHFSNHPSLSPSRCAGDTEERCSCSFNSWLLFLSPLQELKRFQPQFLSISSQLCQFFLLQENAFRQKSESNLSRPLSLCSQSKMHSHWVMVIQLQAMALAWWGDIIRKYDGCLLAMLELVKEAKVDLLDYMSICFHFSPHHFKSIIFHPFHPLTTPVIK